MQILLVIEIMFALNSYNDVNPTPGIHRVGNQKNVKGGTKITWCAIK